MRSRVSDEQLSLALARAQSVSGLARLLGVSRQWAYALLKSRGIAVSRSLKTVPRND